MCVFVIYIYVCVCDQSIIRERVCVLRVCVRSVPKEKVAYEFVNTTQAVCHISFSSYLDGF